MSFAKLIRSVCRGFLYWSCYNSGRSSGSLSVAHATAQAARAQVLSAAHGGAHAANVLRLRPLPLSSLPQLPCRGFHCRSCRNSGCYTRRSSSRSSRHSSCRTWSTPRLRPHLVLQRISSPGSSSLLLRLFHHRSVAAQAAVRAATTATAFRSSCRGLHHGSSRLSCRTVISIACRGLRRRSRCTFGRST